MQTRLTIAFHALSILLILSHLAALILPEPVAWGLWPFTYLPGAWRWIWLGLAVIGCLPPVTRRLSDVVVSAARRWPRWGTAGLALASMGLFWRFRLVHTRWGDAYILANAIPHPEVKLTYNWQAPLTVFVHAKLWAVGHQLLGWNDAMPAYALTSIVAGGVFVVLLARLARDISPDRSTAAMTFGLVATLGTMQLFFGYVENYTLPTVGMLLYLWLGWRCVRGQTDLIWLATVLAVVHGLHPSTIVLAPSLLYLGWTWARQGQPGRYGAAAWRIALPMILVATGVIVLMERGGHGLTYLLTSDRPGGGDGRWFVPLWETTTRWEHYTMFSWGHLIDMINEQLLTAPAAIPGLLLLLAMGNIRRQVTPWTRFLLLAAGLYLLFTWTWNPDYGGQRDWDLFSPVAIPLTLLFVDRLRAASPEPDSFRRAALALIIAQGFHTLAWIYQNTLPWSWPE